MQSLLNQILVKKGSAGSKTTSNSAVQSKNLYLIGDIDTAMSEKIIVSLLEDDKIKETKIINFFISSAGGCLHDCLAMIDLIEFQREVIGYKVYTFGLGEVCSGGFFMFLMGDERILFPRCRVYVHEHVIVGEDAEPYRKKIENMQEEHKLNKMYVDFVAIKLGISYKKAEKLLQKDKWLNDKEIKNFNIATGSLDE